MKLRLRATLVASRHLRDAERLACWPFDVDEDFDALDPSKRIVSVETACAFERDLDIVQPGVVRVIRRHGRLHSKSHFRHRGEWAEGYIYSLEEVSTGAKFHTDQVELIAAVAGSWHRTAVESVLMKGGLDTHSRGVVSFLSYLDDQARISPKVGDLGWRRLRGVHRVGGFPTSYDGLLNCYGSHEGLIEVAGDGVQEFASPEDKVSALDKGIVREIVGRSPDMKGDGDQRYLVGAVRLIQDRYRKPSRKREIPHRHSETSRRAGDKRMGQSHGTSGRMEVTHTGLNGAAEHPQRCSPGVKDALDKEQSSEQQRPSEKAELEKQNRSLSLAVRILHRRRDEHQRGAANEAAKGQELERDLRREIARYERRIHELSTEAADLTSRVEERESQAAEEAARAQRSEGRLDEERARHERMMRSLVEAHETAMAQAATRQDTQSRAKAEWDGRHTTGSSATTGAGRETQRDGYWERARTWATDNPIGNRRQQMADRLSSMERRARRARERIRSWMETVTRREHIYTGVQDPRVEDINRRAQQQWNQLDEQLDVLRRDRARRDDRIDAQVREFMSQRAERDAKIDADMQAHRRERTRRTEELDADIEAHRRNTDRRKEAMDAQVDAARHRRK